MINELGPNQLRRVCDPNSFEFTTTDELPLTSDIIGQPRATQAIEFGLDIDGPGYHIFVLGHSGTGRSTTIRNYLAERAVGEPVPSDWIYVNDFKQPHSPRAVSLPAGVGVRFKSDMDALVEELKEAIPAAFQADEYRESRGSIEAALKTDQERVVGEVDAQAKERGFLVVRTAAGLVVAPARDGQPIPPEELNKLPGEEQNRLLAIRSELEEVLNEALDRLRERERQARDAVRELDQDVAASTVKHAVAEIKARYTDYVEIEEYLDEVRADVVDRVSDFVADHPGDGLGRTSPFRRYLVNVLVDSSEARGAPVVIEDNPTYHNLIGRVEYQVLAGTTVTDFTMLKAGALHRANGGYLILRARDLLADPLVWHTLKRALVSGLITLEKESGLAFAVVTLDPEPIPLDLKVVLLGSPSQFYYLYSLDEDFRKLFKVKADFSTYMVRDSESEYQYALFVRARCDEEGLLPFERSGVARVVEYGSRLSEHQDRLSVRFGDVADLLREASYWAGKAERDCVTAEDVERAIGEADNRADRVEDEVRQSIVEGRVLIPTTGEVVGQVNGLALNAVGDHVFGRPARITANTYVGRSGVVDIQREVKLSGPTHGKGVLTLISYLGMQYATKEPINLSANLSFEQTYDEIRGDSASLTELCALLSSLAEVPVRQGIAVTGSVDQQGRVQPVGGVSAKVEGFFSVCEEQGLTGDQGVIIPAINQPNLMLRTEVVEAVSEARFHIYPVSTVDEAIEILTGMKAGKRTKRGGFTKGMFHARVASRLKKLAESLDGNRRSGQRQPRKAPDRKRTGSEKEPKSKGKGRAERKTSSPQR